MIPVRLSISCFLGVFGGLAALFVLRIGLFLTGCCFGLVACMLAMLTPFGAARAAKTPRRRGVLRPVLTREVRREALRPAPGNLVMFESQATVAMVYFAAALLGGLSALWFQRPFVVMTTALGGAFIACVGAFAAVADRIAARVSSC